MYPRGTRLIFVSRLVTAVATWGIVERKFQQGAEGWSKGVGGKMGGRSWRRWRAGVVGNLQQEGKFGGGQTERGIWGVDRNS